MKKKRERKRRCDWELASMIDLEEETNNEIEESPEPRTEMLLNQNKTKPRVEDKMLRSNLTSEESESD